MHSPLPPSKIALAALAFIVLLGAAAYTMRERPTSADVDVPFTSQAPAGDWSEPWQNACEEASIFMVASFYEGDEITRQEAVTKIREILKVKNAAFTVSKDESLATIAAIIEELGLPWTTRIVTDPSTADLKLELDAGRPIIVPVYAPALQDSHYEADYHVLVLTGYDDEKNVFIVNDPGTRSGEGLRFDQEVFMGAIHDLKPGEYEEGRKAVLFTARNAGWDIWFGTGTDDAE